jgi:hypothetical protein
MAYANTIPHSKLVFRDRNKLAILLAYTTCRNPNPGLATKAGACKNASQERKLRSHISCSWECKRVWGNEPSHSQGNSHFGSWSPGGLLNLQRAIKRVKTHWIEAFLISLKSSWNLDVWNGLAWPIWTSETQVMVKRRAESQIGSLTPDH